MYSSRYNTRPRRCREELCKVQYSPILYYLRTVLHWTLYIKTTQRRDQIKFILQKAHLNSTWDRLVHNFQRSENKIKSLSECAELQMPIEYPINIPTEKDWTMQSPLGHGFNLCQCGKGQMGQLLIQATVSPVAVEKERKNFFFCNEWHFMLVSSSYNCHLFDQFVQMFLALKAPKAW